MLRQKRLSATPAFPALIFIFALSLGGLLSALFPPVASAKPPIRRAFFDTYPSAVGTQLDQLPSNSKHCGVCHFDFNGGGPRNPYGFSIETGRNNGLTSEQAILAVENNDADGDGFSNLDEVTSTLFSNTPTFPGFSEANVANTVNIPLNEIVAYLTPSGGGDTTPPVVDLSWPDGGEVLQAGETVNVLYSATDENGVSYVNIYRSDDSGASWEAVALHQSPGQLRDVRGEQAGRSEPHQGRSRGQRGEPGQR